jgi:hypothetical protein
MHRSRLQAILIDCSEDTANAGVQFWSGALGIAPVHSGDPADPYTLLPDAIGGLRLDLQRINGPSRIHLDIATDDIEAEVCRLEALGATRERQVEQWWVMRAPSGHLFCVVPTDDEAFLAQGQRWES